MWRLVLTVSLLCCSAEDSVTCRDENGGEVDWFILYKAPINVQLNNEVTTGLEFIYIYPQGSEIKSGTNTKLINHHEGILANTLKPMFDVGNNKPIDFGFISYNDQPPDGYSMPGPNYGHSKGVVMLDKTSGVWLLHSTPRFPHRRDQNFWPPGGSKKAQTSGGRKKAQKSGGRKKVQKSGGRKKVQKSGGRKKVQKSGGRKKVQTSGGRKKVQTSGGSKNAQTFICVTFLYNEFKKIGNELSNIHSCIFTVSEISELNVILNVLHTLSGEHLQYIRAYPFEHHIPVDFHAELQKVVKKNYQVQPSSDFQDLQSKGGQMFRSIAKQLLVEESTAQERTLDVNTVGNADLYVAILKKTGSSVKVQSWGCQPCRVENTWRTGGKTLENIKCLKTELGNWKSTKDHSKWCVTTDQNKAYTCIADSNRSKSQFERPGGALCIKSEEITKKFNGFIDTMGVDCKNKVGLATKADPDCDSDPDSDCVYEPDPDCDSDSDTK